MDRLVAAQEALDAGRITQEEFDIIGRVLLKSMTAKRDRMRKRLFEVRMMREQMKLQRAHAQALNQWLNDKSVTNTERLILCNKNLGLDTKKLEAYIEAKERQLRHWQCITCMAPGTTSME